MSDYGQLKPPSATGIEVFDKVLENNPDADMRAIPNEWMRNERDRTADLSDALEQAQALQRVTSGTVTQQNELLNMHSERIAELEAALVWLYNEGYQSGHHDTVEGMFTDVLDVDNDDTHDDTVAELMQGRLIAGNSAPKCEHPTAMVLKGGMQCSECGQPIQNPDDYCDPA